MRGFKIAIACAVVLAWRSNDVRACSPTPPDLRATLRGSNVDISWTGSLDPGDQWVLYRGDVAALWAGSPVEAPVTAGAPRTFTEVGIAPTLVGLYWKVRCEGPGGAGPWSNWAFAIAKHLRDATASDDVPEVYYVSLPPQLGLPDIADSSDPTPCAPASGTGDGILNADDLICAWWTTGDGAFNVSRLDMPTCTWQSRMVVAEPGDCTAPAHRSHFGAWTAPLVPDEAVEVTVSRQTPASPRLDNRAVIVGSWPVTPTCTTLALPASGCQPARVLVNMPYHGRFRVASELLCGLQSTWTYVTPNVPDTCSTGAFDGVKPAETFTFDASLGSFHDRTITHSPIGGTRFSGIDFDLGPGDAYEVNLSPGHTTRVLCVDHE